MKYRNILRIVLPLAVVVMLSCGKPHTPKGILSRDEMVKVMREIYISEERINRLSLPRDSANRTFDMNREVIFRHVNVSDTVFRKSLDYYMARPKELEELFTAVVDSLTLQEQRLIVHPTKKE